MNLDLAIMVKKGFVTLDRIFDLDFRHHLFYTYFLSDQTKD